MASRQPKTGNPRNPNNFTGRANPGVRIDRQVSTRSVNRDPKDLRGRANPPPAIGNQVTHEYSEPPSMADTTPLRGSAQSSPPGTRQQKRVHT